MSDNVSETGTSSRIAIAILTILTLSVTNLEYLCEKSSNLDKILRSLLSGGVIDLDQWDEITNEMKYPTTSSRYQALYLLVMKKLEIKNTHQILLKALIRSGNENIVSKLKLKAAVNGNGGQGEEEETKGIDAISGSVESNLPILDTWSLESLNSLKLSPHKLLSLLDLCRRYEITEAIRNLEDAAEDIIRSFDKYKNTAQFLEITRENLKTILSSEKITLNENELFECACRWAGNQCTVKGLEPTGENYREVLSDCLFEIRFPTMTTEEFTKVCLFKNNVLKGEEQLAIYKFIGLNLAQKTNYDKTQLQFKTNPRAAVNYHRTNSITEQPQNTTNPVEVEVNTSSSFGFSVLKLPSQYKLTTSPWFECNGNLTCRSFQVNQKISLHGFGFLGPIAGDTNVEITVQIKKHAFVNRKWAWIPLTGTFTKNIFAQKGKIFYFLLDEPFIVESSTYDSSWRNFYSIYFTLKGPNSISQYMGDSSDSESCQASGVQFHLYFWNEGNPLAELLFKKI